MANIFQNIGRLFGFGKRREAAQRPQTTFGPRDITEVPGGKFLLERLQRRARGEDAGFRPEILSKVASPLAARERTVLREKKIPLISAQASARGVGRGTIPVSRIALEQRATEEGIAERLARLRLAGETQRAQDIENALRHMGGLVRTGAGLQQRAAGESLQDFLRTEGFKEKERGVEEEGAARLTALLATIIGAAVGGPAGAAVGAGIGAGVGKGAEAGVGDLNQTSDDDLLALLSLLQQPSAQVRRQ